MKHLEYVLYPIEAHLRNLQLVAARIFRKSARCSKLSDRRRENESRVMVATLAIASCEPGQALTGAAISSAALCEGRLHRADSFHSRHDPLFGSILR